MGLRRYVVFVVRSAASGRRTCDDAEQREVKLGECGAPGLPRAGFRSGRRSSGRIRFGVSDVEYWRVIIRGLCARGHRRPRVVGDARRRLSCPAVAQMVGAMRTRLPNRGFVATTVSASWYGVCCEPEAAFGLLRARDESVESKVRFLELATTALAGIFGRESADDSDYQ